MGKRVTNKSAGLRRAPPGYALFCSHVAKQGVEYPPKRRLHAKATPNKREIVLQRWTFGCMCTFCFCVLMHGISLDTMFFLCPAAYGWVPLMQSVSRKRPPFTSAVVVFPTRVPRLPRYTANRTK